MEAEPFLNKAIEIGGKDPGLVVSPITSLADLYKIRKEFDKAETSYKNAIRFQEQTDDPEAIANTIENLAKCD